MTKDCNKDNTYPGKNMFNRFDPETTQTTYVVVEAIDKLCCRFRCSFGEKLGKATGGLAAEEIEHRKALLIDMRTNLLPRLDQQLTDLLISLDISDLSREPNPKLLATLEIINKLGDTLGHLRSSTDSIALGPRQASESEDYSCGVLKVYRSNRLLSKINELIETKICSLFHHSVDFIEAWQSSNTPQRHRSEFYPRARKSNSLDDRMKLISITGLSCCMIRGIIDWLPLDDFAILQTEWQPQLDLLNSHLLELVNRIGLPLPPEVKRRKSEDQDSYQSDSSSSSSSSSSASPKVQIEVENSPTNHQNQPEKSSTTENPAEKNSTDVNSPEKNSADVNPPEKNSTIENPAENILTNENPAEKNATSIPKVAQTKSSGEKDGSEDGSDSSDYDSDYSGSSASSGQSEDIPVRRLTVELAKQAIPIVKLVRIFFKKLSRRGSNLRPFTLDEEMSSDELEALLEKLNDFTEAVNEVVRILLKIYDQDDLGEEELELIRNKNKSIPDLFDGALLLLAFYLVPIDPSQFNQDPASPNLFHSWFHELRTSVHKATDNFLSGTYDFESTAFE
ncbi:uncharacterized protein PGTG_11062 [Puccinia graminis f. sp. tritici CRL 75-36-700-3]|uniref:Uncharacterized protein n=1 Tax=Puccinia graminis f. sp. tritici (strain CRL 75-36-700-3 / race SCCL) TaxID=418459 RepID=E3KN97_PUCGT|nr:uncharacterized protein PGTG_11062 [Puccinia graminis f. sp. tritici CRL 75-36-700-3]EFP85733.2 hypothetical protein PGTG_11062 [Puccinia graminis f. sp. tritici CRL 75-36-700-3]